MDNNNSQNESTEEIHKIASVLLSKVLPPSFQKNQKVIKVMNAVSQYLLNPVILDCFLFFHQDFEKKYDNITEHPKENRQETKEALIKTLCEFPPFMIYFKQPLSSYSRTARWYRADGSLLEWCIQLHEDLATFLETEKTEAHSRVVEATYIVSGYLSRSSPNSYSSVARVMPLPSSSFWMENESSYKNTCNPNQASTSKLC